MTIQERIYTFSELGKDLSQLSEEEYQHLALQAKTSNQWFTPDNIRVVLQAVSRQLHPELLAKWAASYNLGDNKPKRVGVVMAGHTPAEGFHDCLCVLFSGHQLLAKLHVQDEVLLKKIFRLLIEINPEFEKQIIVADRLNNIDALLATISENMVAQFTKYFHHIPSIIRTPTKSCAVLNGNETSVELADLAKDMLQDFGLSNRNVSKLYVPGGYSFTHFFESIESWKSLMLHHKYVNNYDYNKSILLINQLPHQDNGFLLLHENEKLFSPVAVVHYEYYKDMDELTKKIQASQHQLQSIVAQRGWYPGSIDFGRTTAPALNEYIGGIDTMQFLSSL
ncbi:acyl-CoA reductase [Rhodocytophaga aerolata]|uniref:Acyl-CoA reductase n=1 Tax=Rhodocytophaga aerolata TaxID=455078 RepID=A0ABT8R0A5_9BACT|nr:acyl-CoA reductase [Rhodocytophaga aerolata]MDO1445106.1 acyl-CoA reductase [Rhodocytophaga aerolata]